MTTPAPPAHLQVENQSSFWRDLVEVARDLWTFRELLGQLAKRDIKIRYKQAVMGFAWALFMPVLVVAAGLVIRLAISSVGAAGLKGAGNGALMVKGLIWSFVVGVVGFATPSLSGNVTLVSKVYFPREVLPIAAVGAVAFDTLIASGAVLLAIPFFGAQFSVALLWVPVLLLLLLCLTVGIALFLSCANLFLRDVKYIVQVLVTFGIFFTPVLYEPAILSETAARVIMLNPLAPILEGMRLVIFEGHNLLQPLVVAGRQGADAVAWAPWWLAWTGLWAIAGLAVVAVGFHRAEFAFAEFV